MTTDASGSFSLVSTFSTALSPFTGTSPSIWHTSPSIVFKSTSSDKWLRGTAWHWRGLLSYMSHFICSSRRECHWCLKWAVFLSAVRPLWCDCGMWLLGVVRRECLAYLYLRHSVFFFQCFSCIFELYFNGKWLDRVSAFNPPKKGCLWHIDKETVLHFMNQLLCLLNFIT